MAPALSGRPPARPPQQAAQEGGGGRATRRVAEPAPSDRLPTRLQQNPSKYLNNGLERDHGHLKQRLRPMRGFKHLAAADAFSRGHALVRNLRNGFSSLTDRVPRPLRLATAWPQLARAI